MAVLRRAQVIAQPVEAVFDAVVDLERFPDWNPTTKRARKLSAGPIDEGCRFELEIKGFGRTIQELQEFEGNRRVRLVPQSKIIGGGHRFLFAAEGERTRVDHELEMIPKGAFR